ncbi:MAG: MerR family transcriptional regulator [bacterium]
MNLFNIRDIENLTGIKAHTLRVWEKRYSIIMPPSSPGKHRQYDNNDLRHILRISCLYHSGVKISRIANMSIEEINSFTYLIDKKTSFEVFINQLIGYSIEMNESSFLKLYSELLETMGEENLYTLIIFPFLVRIGNLWLTGNVVPLQEHFASNLIRNELIASIDRLPRSDTNNRSKVILFCPTGEYHELPLLYLQYILKKNKVKTYFLGVNTSEEIVEQCLGSVKASVLLLYLMTNFTSSDTLGYLKALANRFPDKKIICGGPAFRDVTSIDTNIHLMKDFNKLINECKEIV